MTLINIFYYYYLIMGFSRLGEDEDLSPRNQPLPLMREGPEEEEFTPVPRPSPSPHPQNFQVRHLIQTTNSHSGSKRVIHESLLQV